MDRIDKTPRPDRRFAPRTPPASNLATWVARRVSSARDRYHATVILHAPIETVSPRVPPASGTVEPLDDGRCMLHAGSDWLDGLAIYIANIGVDFEILEPPELVERVRDLAARFARASGPPVRQSRS